MMPEEDYDLAGFTVGVVDKKKIIDGSRHGGRGRAARACQSSGVHSNGFSLVRKVFGIGADDRRTWKPVHYYDELGATLGETLLDPHPHLCQARAGLPSRPRTSRPSPTSPAAASTKTSPRMLKEGLTAKIDKAAVPVLPIFELIQDAGNIPERDMFNTFNMGVGLCVAVSEGHRPGRPGRASTPPGKRPLSWAKWWKAARGSILC